MFKLNSCCVLAVLLALAVADTVETDWFGNEVRDGASGICGRDCRWILDTDSGKLVVGGTGEIEGHTTWGGNKGSIKTVEIQKRITSIGNAAFKDCRAMTSISIPDSVVSIGESAFSGCKSLSSVAIPEAVNSLGASAFKDCRALTSVEIPDGVASIGAYTFSGCSKLTSVTIPESIGYIFDYAFDGCTALSSVELPKYLQKIGDFAFHDCEKITSVTIPKNVSSIGENAFGGCTSLTSIDVDAGNAKYKSENGFLLDKAGTTLMQVPAGKESVSIPANVTTIQNYAFDKSKLPVLAIPNTITAIGSNCFYKCPSLYTVGIAASVATIDSSAFHQCANLSSICYEGTSDPGANSTNVFDDCPLLTEVSVVKAYTGDKFCGQTVKKVRKCEPISGAELAKPVQWLVEALSVIVPLAVLSLLQH